MATQLEIFRAWAGTLADLRGTMALLDWDRDTVMPASGSSARAQGLGTLASLYHRELTRPDIADVLDAVADDADATGALRREVELLRHERDRASCLPEPLVRELSEASSISVVRWAEARARNDWDDLYRPLARVVALKRDQAAAISGGGSDYDALLDEYEPGAHAGELARIFDSLARRLTALIAEARGLPAPRLPDRFWPRARQLELAHDIAEMIGFDLHKGRIGTAAHPFSTQIGLGDVRFTTRIDERNPTSSILSVLHESGHAMYEQGMPTEFARTALAEAPSLGAHEGQARFWENHVGRSRAFWQIIEPRMHSLFPEAMHGLDADIFFAVTNHISPTLIRVDADEATYNLHVLLRFELEMGLFNGTLEVADLPEAWNSRMHDLLGIDVPGPADGVMQDVHWPDGMFGYFPTYALGNLYAAQLADAADAELGSLDAAIGQGDFRAILGFMRERIHRHGAMLPTSELIARATGAPLSPEPLIAHLERRVATLSTAVHR